jgi:hypothetical protein
MADDPKIVLDPPPSEPFDVPTSPDGPPVEPFDVPVYPDPGPGGTFDVPVSPDSVPREPVDVPTYPDGPPLKPFDVPLAPDGPPRKPTDVPLTLDPPPAVPFDVPNGNDPPPAAPIDVPTYPDGPPALPFDPGVTPDAPPPTPFDPGVTPDSPPADPFDVPIEPSPPPLLIEGGINDETTITKIINAVKGFDPALGSFLAGLKFINPIDISVQGGGALDPRMLADWFRDYTQAVGPGAVSRFMSQQQELFAMNPVVARVFDPLYFVKMMVPGAMGHAHATLDTQLGTTGETVARAKDELVQGKVHLRGVPEVNDLNLYNPESTQADGQEFSIDEMVDAAVDGVPHPFLKRQRDGTGITRQVFDANAYFNDRDSSGLQRNSFRARSRVGTENVQSREPQLAASAFVNGIIRAQISPKEDPDGAIYSQTQNPSTVVDDDEARVPLCFTDLRKDPVRRAYRSIYFRPMNLAFSNAISPEWTEASSFGRTDPILGYQKTSRTYSVSFELHAFAPEDLEVMYKKMTWLTSMCYPSYGLDSLMRSGPVTRMRIGDAVATESGGISGVIKSLNFDFADALWELKQGLKVPRSFKVSVDFQVLHEGPVGILNGAFGVFKLPPPEQEKKLQPGQFTNFVDQGIANAGHPRDGSPKGAELLPGMFSKFGEPRRK